MNLSARQLAQDSLVEMVTRVLNETGLEPRVLALEVTESAVIQDLESARQTLGVLAAMGVELHMDDFGTGYSSLSFLKQLPFHVVKIDRAFVSQVSSDPEEASLTRAIIAMAHGLHKRTIAEGIEEADQLEFLKRHACDEGQGYYFGRPAAPEDLSLPWPRAI